MKSVKRLIRKHYMGQLYHTTELAKIKDKNISLDKLFHHKTHIEVWARLDYSPKLF